MTSRRQALQAILAGGLLLPQLGHAAPAPRKLERGVALGLFHEDPLWSYRGLLKELADLSASHVSLVPAYYQEHAGSTEIGSHPRFSVPDETILSLPQWRAAWGSDANSTMQRPVRFDPNAWKPMPNGPISSRNRLI